MMNLRDANGGRANLLPCGEHRFDSANRRSSGNVAKNCGDLNQLPLGMRPFGEKLARPRQQYQSEQIRARSFAAIKLPAVNEKIFCVVRRRVVYVLKNLGGKILSVTYKSKNNPSAISRMRTCPLPRRRCLCQLLAADII